MNINWKVRLKNKTFIITMSTLVIAFVYQVLAAFDVVPRITEDSLTELVTMVVNVLAMLGVVVDPTTSGISDSDRAMTYETENDVRNTEDDV